VGPWPPISINLRHRMTGS